MKIKHDAPEYPDMALKKEIEGWVVLRFSILEDGTAADIEVLFANVEDIFDQAAIDAASEWTYKPATRNGKPIAQ